MSDVQLKVEIAALEQIERLGREWDARAARMRLCSLWQGVVLIIQLVIFLLTLWLSK